LPLWKIEKPPSCHPPNTARPKPCCAAKRQIPQSDDAQLAPGVEAGEGAVGAAIGRILEIGNVGQIVGFVNSLAEREGGVQRESLGELPPNLERSAMIDGVGGPGDKIHGGETGVETVKPRIEQVAGVAVDVVLIVEAVSRGADVIGFQHDPQADLALHAEKPVVRVGVPEARIHGPNRSANALQSVVGVQAQT
jgi:hypothetical protein